MRTCSAASFALALPLSWHADDCVHVDVPGIEPCSPVVQSVSSPVDWAPADEQLV